MKFYWVFVALGGALGSIIRYLIQIFFKKNFDTIFPLATFSINILGCFLIGVFYGISNKYLVFNTSFKLFLIVGFCGGFTTFSSFSYENLVLLQNGNYINFIIYSVLSLFLGVMAVVLGLMIINSL